MPRNYQYNNRNGNAANGAANGEKIRNVVIWLSLIVSLGSIGNSVFRMGGEESRIEEHLHYLDQKVERDESEAKQYVRTDVLEPQLTILKEEVKKANELLERQNQFIQNLEERLAQSEAKNGSGRRQ